MRSSLKLTIMLEFKRFRLIRFDSFIYVLLDENFPQADEAADIINQWVANSTADLIKDVRTS